ncbi:MAG: isochorismatase family protein [Candidatus Nanohaloarchaea archaeon]|nr:isochorismatase family protein [Candidatus Nanohaloarchaea archaeon]
MTDTTTLDDVLFWDVDTQHDFIDPDGKLAVPGADDRVDRMARLTEYAADSDVYHGGSVDAHEPDDPEFEVYPPHCVDGTPGQQKLDATTRDPLYVPEQELTDDQQAEVADYAADGGQVIFEKRSPDVRDNPNLADYVEAVDPDAVAIYGVVTEICVDQAVDYFVEDTDVDQVYVVEDAIHELDGDDRDAAFEDWQDRGVEFITTWEIEDGRSFAEGIAEPQQSYGREQLETLYLNGEMDDVDLERHAGEFPMYVEQLKQRKEELAG